MTWIRTATVLLAVSFATAGKAQGVSFHADTVLWSAVDQVLFAPNALTIYNNTPVDRTIYTNYQPVQFTVNYNGRDTTMQHAYVALSAFLDRSVYRFTINRNGYLTISPNPNAPSDMSFFANPGAAHVFAEDMRIGVISSYIEVAMCAMVLIMALYILGKYIQLRTHVYLFYWLYLLFTLLFLVVVLLYTKEAWQQRPLLRGYMHHMAQSASHACYFQFVRYFIQTRQHQPLFDKVLNWGSALSLGYILSDGIAMLLAPQHYPYAIVWDGVQIIYLIFGIVSLIVWIAQSPSPLKKYLIVGAGGLLTGGIVGLLVLLMPHWVESLPVPLSVQVFYYRAGILVEIVSFSLGLGYMQRLDEISLAQAEAKWEQEKHRVSNLQEVDRLKSRFLAGISHEFRTPLTLILAQAHDYLHTPGAWQAAFKSIHTNGRLLLNLVTQILDLSRIDAGKLQLHKEPTDPARAVKNSLQMFHSLAEQKQLTIETSLNSRHQLISVDPSVLEKIINNLLSNAIKYTPAGGRIQVDCDLPAKHLRICVRDNGIGVSSEDLSRIFDRFYRASEYGEGTGIGLALTKELVELQGGHINVTSQLGTGTCFEVLIPVEHLEAPLPHVNGNSIESKEATQEEHLEAILDTAEQDNSPDNLMLVVEDHDELRSYIAQAFKREYRVITASNGAEGLDKATAMVPDIIITDWMMPGMSGTELCLQLKTLAATSHIPVIMLTAKADTEAKVEGLTSGADDYVTKPFEWPELQVRVSNQVKMRKVLQEKFSDGGNMKKAHDGLSTRDKAFIETLYGLFDQRLDDSELSVEQLSREVGMSRVQLHRKTKSITGHAISDLLRDYRLTKAAELLRQDAGNISEIAYQVGFDNLSYFAKAFRQKYQKTPSEFKQPT